MFKGIPINHSDLWWRDAEINPPQDDRTVLISFYNFNGIIPGYYDSVPEDGGIYRAADTAESFLSDGLMVKGWMPMPDAEHMVEEWVNGET